MKNFRRAAILTFVGVFAFFYSFKTKDQYYTKIEPGQSGIDMVNTIPDFAGNYIYASNGNGIGIGDFNNDGLQDIFFSSNNSYNRLYLNKSKFQFKDISSEANIKGNGRWGSGVSVIDINDDGWLDVYVAHSGPYNDASQLVNELFINKGLRNGMPYFEEEAGKYGLDLPGSNSTQASFFDFDKDGDLDVFILNHSTKNFVKIQPAALFHKGNDTTCSNQLLRNDGNHFVNITGRSGLIFSTANYGLGVIISDLNNDGWEDIYSTSDFEERDFCYLNQRDGTFKEVLEKSFGHISANSMGVDAGDINNDGRMDLVTLDMLPESNQRQKIILANESLDKYLTLERNGFFNQQVRNMLQVNAGIDKNGLMHFSETGQLSRISNTDWSWAPLFFDYDNDGLNDLFITSGYAKDYSNLDVLNNYNTSNYTTGKQYPDLKLPVRFFRNKGSLDFTELSNPLGITEEKISGAAVYADFDNDGKMDLLYSNLNEQPSLYRNNGSSNNYIKISLIGPAGNRNAIGSKVFVTYASGEQIKEVQPVRGYQSTQDNRLNFGINNSSTVHVKVQWPNGQISEIKDVGSNQHLVIKYQQSEVKFQQEKSVLLYKKIDNEAINSAKHTENSYIDFRHQYTVPYMVSTVGPAVASGDINGDGFADIYQGGAKGYTGQLLISKGAQDFTITTPASFMEDKNFEDVSAIFFDVDTDGDLDLAVASGGTDYEQGSLYYQDRLYINDGKGNFIKHQQGFPKTNESSKGVITTSDFDKDGDADLFIGGYTVANAFGTSPRSYLLRNDSKKDSIQFTDVTDKYGPEVKYMGMVTSAKWKDADNDGYEDLLIATEWSNCKYFKNKEGKSFKDISSTAGLTALNGLWSSINADDIDGDGDIDIVAGNAGLNLQLSASPSKPLRLYITDLNASGKSNALVSYFIGQKEYPIYFRDEFLEEAFTMKQRYPTYQDYAKADMQDLFKGLNNMPIPIYEVNEMRSGIFIQQDGKFSFKPLNTEVQLSRINSLEIFDFNKDGKKDILIAGNFYGYRKRFGKSDALAPTILQQNRNSSFDVKSPDQTGFYLWEETRKAIISNNGNSIIFFNNNSKPAMYEKN